MPVLNVHDVRDHQVGLNSSAPRHQVDGAVLTICLMVANWTLARTDQKKKLNAYRFGDFGILLFWEVPNWFTREAWQVLMRSVLPSWWTAAQVLAPEVDDPEVEVEPEVDDPEVDDQEVDD